MRHFYRQAVMYRPKFFCVLKGSRILGIDQLTFAKSLQAVGQVGHSLSMFILCKLGRGSLPGCSTSALQRSTRYSTTSLWPFLQLRTSGVAPLVRAETS